ncbi:transcriptional regulator, partial [Vibrio vulnificus]
NLAFIESELESILGKSCRSDVSHCAQ